VDLLHLVPLHNVFPGQCQSLRVREILFNHFLTGLSVLGSCDGRRIHRDFHCEHDLWEDIS
jgi:hypothetical protein